MTMADTVAVMNAGVIEQLGAPRELYEHPTTTFVANFLGQSNLIRGKVSGGDARVVRVDVDGGNLWVPTSRAMDQTGDVWVGVRPEKIFLAEAGSETGDGSNLIGGGVITDVSFIGVSTQYLTRMPWGQELMVFEQNTGARDGFREGDRVDLHWMPDHTFLLDASQAADAGVEREEAS